MHTLPPLRLPRTRPKPDMTHTARKTLARRRNVSWLTSTDSSRPFAHGRLGQPEPEVWPSSRLVKKLRTKLSLGGGRLLLYYRERPECGPKDVPKVKLYSY